MEVRGEVAQTPDFKGQFMYVDDHRVAREVDRHHLQGATDAQPLHV